jgi:ATP-dependent DNA helicase PIF1
MESLSPEQKIVVELVACGKNVFFTGAGGTGKSFLIQYLIDNVLPKETSYVTASTGIAASHLSGTTLHSFAGIGLGTESKEQLLKNLPLQARKRWERAHALFIDELSMIDDELLDKLEYIARIVRDDESVFGGLQIVAAGDMLQLGSCSKSGRFCFESKLWPAIVPNVILLKTFFRQRDQDFVRALNEARFGKLSAESIKMFASCVNRELKCEHGIEPTLLYALKKNVKEINDQKLEALPGDIYTYDWQVGGSSSSAIAALKKNFNGCEHLQLKIGAQVILIKNLDSALGLVNGSRGIVTAFDSLVEGSVKFPVVTFARGQTLLLKPEGWHTIVEKKVLATIMQVPLIHGWCMTIHKAQGMTLDFAKVQMSGIFECGQAYVALSRVRSLDTLSLVDFSPHTIRAHPKAVQFYEALARS